MTDPLSRNTGMRLAGRQLEMEGIVAAANDAIANLNRVAATASSAINNSAQDRLNIHALLTDLTTTVAALQAQTAPAFGTATTPALGLLGSSSDVTVALSHPMPTTSYTVAPIVSGLAAGKLTATVKTRTLSSVTITLTAGLAAVGTGTLTVLAWTGATT